MKVAITSKESTLDSKIDERFGRSEYFAIFDLENSKEYFIKNTAKDEESGAGGSAVRLLTKEGVDTLIAPHLGPKATTALNTFDVKVYSKGEYVYIKEAIEALKEDRLETIKLNLPQGLVRV